MTLEANRERMRSYYREVWEGVGASKAPEYLADTFTDHNPPPGVPGTRDAHMAAIGRIMQAFPDMTFQYPHLIAEGDTVIGHWVMQGTHQGSVVGEPPSGKPVVISGIDIARFENGKVVDLWHIEDQLGMLAQIGMFPPPGVPAPAGA